MQGCHETAISLALQKVSERWIARILTPVHLAVVSVVRRVASRALVEGRSLTQTDSADDNMKTAPCQGWADLIFMWRVTDGAWSGLRTNLAQGV